MKKNYFKLEIITPNGVVYSENVVHVRAPGKEGMFGVLVNHIPFLFLLKTGHLEVEAVGPNTVFAITEGFARMSDGIMRVVVESAHDAKKIDVNDVMQSKRRAECFLQADRKRLNKKLVKREIDKAENKLAAVAKVNRKVDI